jgi:SAM-dependent methyltransferase
MALEDWLHVARDGTDEDVRESILTGAKDGKPFTPYVPTLAMPVRIGSALDFGCGLGRNFPYLTSIADRVTGFDLPPMIARCRAVLGSGAPALTDDWQALRGERFDLVFAALVFQHIEPSMLETYVADIARRAPVVYVLTRTGSDYGGNVLAAIDRQALFRPAGSCVEVEHDARTNQLRAIRELPFEDACRAGGSSHYEFLLRSRIPPSSFAVRHSLLD